MSEKPGGHPLSVPYARLLPTLHWVVANGKKYHKASLMSYWVGERLLTLLDKRKPRN